MGGRLGLDYDVSSTTEEWGRYEVAVDVVCLYFRDGQCTARGRRGRRRHRDPDRRPVLPLNLSDPVLQALRRRPRVDRSRAP
jgi:hypothetical protein